MTRQYINVDDKWSIVVYHGADETDEREIRNALRGSHCPEEEIDHAIDVISQKNTGFTFTLPQARMSVVAISQATDKTEYMNTVAHEAKHVVTAIADHYHINSDGERAAYLLGDIVMQMMKWVS